MIDDDAYRLRFRTAEATAGFPSGPWSRKQKQQHYKHRGWRPFQVVTNPTRVGDFRVFEEDQGCVCVCLCGPHKHHGLHSRCLARGTKHAGDRRFSCFRALACCVPYGGLSLSLDLHGGTTTTASAAPAECSVHNRNTQRQQAGARAGSAELRRVLGMHFQSSKASMI